MNKILNDMWEWLKKDTWRMIFLSVIVVLIIALTFTSISLKYYHSKYDKVSAELKSHEDEMENAVDREAELLKQIELAKTITSHAVTFVNEQESLLLTGGETIKEIKASVMDLERYASQLELYIFTINNNLEIPSELPSNSTID